MKITMQDIARRAGVSAATVSRVINGSTAVSEDKRAAVLSILDAVDVPLRAAPKRRGETQHSVGILLLDGVFNDPSVVLRKLHQLVLRLPNDFTLRLLSPDTHAELLKSWHRKGLIDGLILLGHGRRNRKLAPAIQVIPHVWLNSHAVSGLEPAILSGNESSGRIAAKYLIDRGGRRLLLLTLPGSNPGYAARIEGFRFECFTTGTAYDERCGVLPDGASGFEECDGAQLERSIEQALKTVRLERYDGLFVPESRLMAFAHRVLTRRGVRPLPRMISCNAGDELFAGLHPRPAYVDFDIEMIVQLALEQLRYKLLGGPDASGRVRVIVNPVLVEGDPIETPQRNAPPSAEAGRKNAEG